MDYIEPSTFNQRSPKRTSRLCTSSVWAKSDLQTKPTKQHRQHQWRIQDFMRAPTYFWPFSSKTPENEEIIAQAGGISLAPFGSANGGLTKYVHIFRYFYKQESPPAWMQEAHRPPRSKYTLCCSGGGRGAPAGGGGWYPLPGGVLVSWMGVACVEVWTDTQSENITFPHASDAGGKYWLY